MACESPHMLTRQHAWTLGLTGGRPFLAYPPEEPYGAPPLHSSHIPAVVLVLPRDPVPDMGKGPQADWGVMRRTDVLARLGPRVLAACSGTSGFTPGLECAAACSTSTVCCKV